MKPENKIKKAILLKHKSWNEGFIIPELTTDEQVQEFYEASNENYELQDDEEEFRGGQVETKLECEYSRHYEAKSVAAKMDDGTWIGWTYWFGGGKHGEPEAIEWMEDAYKLNCVERQETVTVRDFTKVVAVKP